MLHVFAEEIIDDEDLFPEDTLSNHMDMVQSEPGINEAKRNFIRSDKQVNTFQHLCDFSEPKVDTEH